MVGSSCWWPVGAAAETYPNRTVKVVVPYDAGGPSDVVARTIADKLSSSLRQPFVIENRPGAGGNIGTDIVAKAAPDGHTLGLVVSTTLTVNPSLYRKLPFDPEKDIRPIAIVATTGLVLAVHPSVPVHSVAEFVAYAKAASATKVPIAYGSAGNGTPSHLAMESFRVHAGFEAVQVPYRSVAPMLVDLMAGQVKAGFVGTAAIRHTLRGLDTLGSEWRGSADRHLPRSCRQLRSRVIQVSRPSRTWSSWRRREFPAMSRSCWSARCRPS